MHSQTSHINNIKYDYLLDLIDRDNQHLYFKMKNKYEYTFTEVEKNKFKMDVLNQLSLNNDWVEAQILIIPETGNICLKEIAEASGKEVVYLNKNKKEAIKENLDKQSLMKAEREKLYASIDAMDTVKIAGIAGNQRKRFVNFLFEDILLTEEQKNKNVVFFDDSIFSGFTFLAAQHMIKEIEHKNIVIFNKQADMLNVLLN